MADRFDDLPDNEKNKSDTKDIIEGLYYLEAEARKEGLINTSNLMREVIIKIENNSNAFIHNLPLKDELRQRPAHFKIHETIELLKQISELNDTEFENVRRFINTTKN